MNRFEFYEYIKENNLHLEGDVWVDEQGNVYTPFYLEWKPMNHYLYGTSRKWYTRPGVYFSKVEAELARTKLMENDPTKYYEVRQANMIDDCW